MTGGQRIKRLEAYTIRGQRVAARQSRSIDGPSRYAHRKQHPPLFRRRRLTLPALEPLDGEMPSLDHPDFLRH
jgi:hypothetical protein